MSDQNWAIAKELLEISLESRSLSWRSNISTLILLDDFRATAGDFHNNEL